MQKNEAKVDHNLQFVHVLQYVIKCHYEISGAFYVLRGLQINRKGTAHCLECFFFVWDIDVSGFFNIVMIYSGQL
jgi:hypothetical protein